MSKVPAIECNVKHNFNEHYTDYALKLSIGACRPGHARVISNHAYTHITRTGCEDTWSPTMAKKKNSNKLTNQRNWEKRARELGYKLPEFVGM